MASGHNGRKVKKKNGGKRTGAVCRLPADEKGGGGGRRSWRGRWRHLQGLGAARAERGRPTGTAGRPAGCQPLTGKLFSPLGLSSLAAILCHGLLTCPRCSRIEVGRARTAARQHSAKQPYLAKVNNMLILISIFHLSVGLPVLRRHTEKQPQQPQQQKTQTASATQECKAKLISNSLWPQQTQVCPFFVCALAE